MTAHRQHNQGEHIVDRYLAGHQQALVESLGSVLDIDAGLREILLQSRYNAQVDSLDTVLNVDAGLGAILSASALAEATSQAEFGSPKHDRNAVKRLIQALNPQERLMLRSHPTVKATIRALGLAVALARFLPRVLVLARTLNIGRTRALELNRALGYAHARARALARALDHAHALDYALALDLARARDLSRTLDLARSLGPTFACIIDLTRALNSAQDLVNSCLEQAQAAVRTVLGRQVRPLDADAMTEFLDDFTTADLRTADLTGVDLTGVRWSEDGTLWPEDVDIEELKARSKEVPGSSGIYIIRSGTASARDLANLG